MPKLPATRSRVQLSFAWGASPTVAACPVLAPCVVAVDGGHRLGDQLAFPFSVLVSSKVVRRPRRRAVAIVPGRVQLALGFVGVLAAGPQGPCSGDARDLGVAPRDRPVVVDVVRVDAYRVRVGGVVLAAISGGSGSPAFTLPPTTALTLASTSTPNPSPSKAVLVTAQATAPTPAVALPPAVTSNAFSPACERGESSSRASAPSSLSSLSCLPKNNSRPPYPAYVEACANGAWSLRLWRKDAVPDSHGVVRARSVPYRCRSWRHVEGGRPSGCANAWTSATYHRLRAAFADVPAGDVVYVVLTIDPKRWPDARAAYRALFRCEQRFRQRVESRYGKFKYANVVESTRRGWPHSNLVIVSPSLGAACGGDGWRRVRREMVSWLEQVGLGYVVWVERARSVETLIGYAAKLAGGMLPAEVAKTTQSPLNAPRHFRRVRASRGFLPPSKVESRETGVLVKFPVDVDAAGAVERVRWYRERAALGRESREYWARECVGARGPPG